MINEKDRETNSATSNSDYNIFNILDYIDQLEEDGGSASKGQESFHCPACGAPNFKVDHKTAAYYTFSCGCAMSEGGKKKIRNALSPAKKPKNEVIDHQTTANDPLKPAKVTLAKFPEDYTPKLATSETIDENLVKTTYRYSGTQLIIREDYPEGKPEIKNKKPKLNEAGEPILSYKKFSYYTKDENGDWSYKKGDKNWEAYNLEEAIKYGYNAYVLVVEGEKAVETARSELGIPTITFRNWNEEGIKPSLNQLKNNGVAGVIMFPDNDATGQKDAKAVEKWCDQIDLNYYKLNPTDVWSEMPDKGDVVDWVKHCYSRETDMTRPTIIEELEQAIHKAVDSKAKSLSLAKKKAPLTESNYYIKNKKKTPIEPRMSEDWCDDWVVFDESFYQWQKEGYWKKIKNTRVRKAVSTELKKYYEVQESGDEESEFEKIYNFSTAANVKKCFSYLKDDLSLDIEIANKHLLSLKNGTIDLRTGEIRDHNRDDYLTRHLPFDYIKSDEAPPLFKEFLLHSYGEHQLKIIRAMISMYLDPTAPFGKAFHLLGLSGSGKGFMGRIIRELVGMENAGTVDDLELIADPDKRHQYLNNRSLIVLPDVSGFVKNPQGFYELVDNGSKNARALFGDGYEKIWNVRFIITSVNPLAVENAGEGWNRRIIPLKTLGKQPSPNATPNLEKRVKNEELGLILGWALSMPREDRDAMLFNSKLWSQESRDLQFEQSTHSDGVRSFIDACLFPSTYEGMEIDTNTLYGYYKAYSLVTGNKAKSLNNFVSGIKNALPSLYQKGKTYRDKYGNAKKSKPKFTNMMLLAKFEGTGGNRVCDLNSLCYGGYEEFVNFMAQPEQQAVEEAKPEPQPESEPVPKPEPQPESEPVPKPESQPVAEPVAQPEPQPESEPVPKPEPQPEPEPVVQAVKEDEPEPQAVEEDKLEPEPEPVDQPKPLPQVRWAITEDQIQEDELTQKGYPTIDKDFVEKVRFFDDPKTWWDVQDIKISNIQLKNRVTEEICWVNIYACDLVPKDDINLYKVGDGIKLRDKVHEYFKVVQIDSDANQLVLSSMKDGSPKKCTPSECFKVGGDDAWFDRFYGRSNH